MTASLSIERKIQNFIDLRETSADFLSSLAALHDISGASTSRLYQAMRDSTRSLPAETAIPLGKLIDDLERYCASMHPVPVALRNAILIKGLLDDFRKSCEEKNLRPIPFNIVLIGGRPFKRIADGQVETVDDYLSCAAFRDLLTARAAAQILDGMVSDSVRTTTITNQPRAPETVTSRLSDVGFESAAVAVKQ